MNKIDYSVFYEEKSLEFVTHICVFTITDVSCDYCSPFSNPFLLMDDHSLKFHAMPESREFSPGYVSDYSPWLCLRSILTPTPSLQSHTNQKWQLVCTTPLVQKA